MSTFRGYDTDLLISLKAHGRALVGNDALYDAAQEYTDPATGGGIYGRALLDTAPQVDRRRVPDTQVSEDEPEDADGEEADPWEHLSILQLRDLLKEHKVEFPRTMTRWGAIKRLTAANISPPT